MLRSGTTCCNDVYYMPNETASIVTEIGMRAVIGLMGHDDAEHQQTVSPLSTRNL